MKLFFEQTTNPAKPITTEARLEITDDSDFCHIGEAIANYRRDKSSVSSLLHIEWVMISVAEHPDTPEPAKAALLNLIEQMDAMERELLADEVEPAGVTPEQQAALNQYYAEVSADIDANAAVAGPIPSDHGQNSEH